MNRLFKTGLTAIAVAVLLLPGCRKNPSFDLDKHIGICGTAHAEAAAAAGLDYLEANVFKFLMPEQSDEDFAANAELAKTMVPPIYSANGFYPGDIRLTGPDVETERAIQYANTAIRRAAQIGMKVLVLGSGRARAIPEGFDRAEAEAQFLSLLKGMAPAAEQYDVLIAIEPLQLSECNFINLVSEGAEIARKTGSSHICVLADFYHMARMNEGPEGIFAAADKLVHCHIAECRERTAPGVDGDDFTPYFRALKEIGYSGRISFECRWSDVSAQLPEAVRVVKEQIESVK